METTKIPENSPQSVSENQTKSKVTVPKSRTAQARQRIYSIKNNGLNEQDRLDLVRMLAKAGYAVKVGREKIGKSSSYSYYVEFWEESDE